MRLGGFEPPTDGLEIPRKRYCVGHTCLYVSVLRGFVIVICWVRIVFWPRR